MNVIEMHTADREALNGLFDSLFSSTSSGEQKRKANDMVQDIKNDHGFNDLMYMKPENAAKSLNRMLEELSYHEALNLKRVGDHKSSTSKNAYRDAAKIFSDASAEVLSQFRQYAIGMDGEVSKIGATKKKREYIEFEAPFYKLVLPQKAAGTTPVDGVTKDDLLSFMQGFQNGTANEATNIAGKNNTTLYVALGAGALAVTGAAIYFIKKGKK